MHTMNFLEIFHYRPSARRKKKFVTKKNSEQEVILAMKSFSNNKSPGNNDLTRVL